MLTLVKYIRQCYDAKDKTELAETFDNLHEEDFYEEIKDMKHDALLFIHKHVDENDWRCLRYLSHINGIEYIQIGNTFIVRIAPKPIYWYDAPTAIKPEEISFTESREPLYRRLIPSSMDTLETVSVSLIMSAIINEMRKHVFPKKKLVYIEYGVSSGKTLFSIAPLVHLAHGVDINEIVASYHTNIERHQMTTEKFSAKHLPGLRYHIALIDADHSVDVAMKDFDALFEYIEPGGLLFLHDTYPCLPWLLEPKFCYDCYKTPLRIKEKYGNLVEILTLPLNPGLTIVRKK